MNLSLVCPDCGFDMCRDPLPGEQLCLSCQTRYVALTMDLEGEGGVRLVKAQVAAIESVTDKI